MVFADIPQQEIRQIATPQNDTKQVKILYTNYRGEKAYRIVIPDSIYFGSTQWHPGEQWLLRAFDVQKNEWRDFAVKDIAEWHPFETNSGK